MSRRKKRQVEGWKLDPVHKHRAAALLAAGINRYERDTGRRFRSAFKSVPGKTFHCGVTPADLRVSKPFDISVTAPVRMEI